MKKLNLLWVGLLCAALACNNSNNALLMSSVSGKAGEVIVVVNKQYWDGQLGDTLRSALEREYRVLPQNEKMYDLVDVPPAKFGRLFQSHRNIIILNISPEHAEPKIEVRRDVYAAPQIIIVISSPDEASATRFVYDERVKIVELLEQAERNRVIMNTKKYQDYKVRNTVMEMFGGAPYFPEGYTIRKITDNFVWVAYDSRPAIQGVLIFSYPYTGQHNFNMENMMATQKAILKEQVPSSGEGSYMTIADSKTPELRFIKHHDLHFAELRGLWETTNPTFMGGPFVSHSFLNREGADVVVLMAFVYAPGKDKRNFMRQTEAFLYSFEWAEQPAEK